MKSFFAALALCALLVPAGAGEQVQFVDSKIGIYVKYGGANIRIDKIESVRHSDYAEFPHDSFPRRPE